MGANQTSYAQARQVLWDTLRLSIDPKRIERVTHRVGEDRLAEVADQIARFTSLPLAEKFKAPPGLALTPKAVAIQIDGGRYQRRAEQIPEAAPQPPPEISHPPEPSPPLAAVPDPISLTPGPASAGRTRAEGAAVYQRWIQWAWSGEIPRLQAEMQARQAELGHATRDEPETNPRNVLAGALGYITANASRMHYPQYRRQGLPVTSCLVESTVKQLNQRVKGTEKFWSGPGSSAVLQLRADSLSDVRTLDDFFHRRETAATGQRP